MFWKIRPYLPALGVVLVNTGLQISGITNFTLAVVLWILAALCFILALPIKDYFRRSTKPLENTKDWNPDIPSGWEVVSGKRVYEFVKDSATHSATFTLKKKD